MSSGNVFVATGTVVLPGMEHELHDLEACACFEKPLPQDETEGQRRAQASNDTLKLIAVDQQIDMTPRNTQKIKIPPK
eukprot:3079067-Amphidinium_carterae.1